MFKLKNSIQITIIIFLCLLVVPVSFAQETETVVRIVPVNAEVGVGETIQIAVEIANVSELYGADVTVNYDPDTLEVIDADSELEGIQVALGTFLDNGLVLRNSADNSTGTIRFAMTQLFPSEAKNGTGIFIVVTFLAKQISANTPVTLAYAQLGNMPGTGISTQVESGELSIIADTPSGPTRTPIPIQLPGTPLPDSTDNLVTNTPGPTPTVDAANTITNTPLAATATAVSANNTPITNTPSVATTSSAADPTQPPAATATAPPVGNSTTTTASEETNPVATEAVVIDPAATEIVNTDNSAVAEDANGAATAVSAINSTIGSDTNNANQNAAQVIGENAQVSVTAVPTTNTPAESSPLPFVLALLVSLVFVLIIAVVIIQRRQSRSQG